MAANGSNKATPEATGALNAGSVVKLLLLMAALGVAVGLVVRLLPSRTPAPPPTNTTAKPPANHTTAQSNQGNAQRGNTDVKPGPDDQTVPGDVKPPPDDTTVQKPDAEVVPAEDQRAKELLESARASLKQMDFAVARKACDEAAPLKAAPETRRDIKAFGQKVEQFEWSVAHIEVSEFARAEKSCALQLRNGRRLRGLIADRQAERLTLIVVSEQNPATMGIPKMTIPLADIEKETEVTLAERQTEFLALLGRLEKDLSLNADSPAEQYFDVVVLSRRLGLTDKCFGYLEAAEAKTADHAVGTLFRRLVIDRAIARATLLAAAGQRIQAEDVLRRLTNRTLPNYPPAAEAVTALRRDLLSKMKDDFVSTLALQSSPAASGDSTPMTAQELASDATGNDAAKADARMTTTSDPKSAKPAADKICLEANRSYQVALADLRTYRRNPTDALFDQLRDLLGNIVDRYGEALDLDPTNKAIENRQLEANALRYMLIKGKVIAIKKP